MTEPTQEQIQSLEARLAHEPQSPLFARLAAYYLSSGRAKDALRVCDNGLAHFPFYSTAHLIKGNALVSLGMTAEAKHEYEVVREFMPTNETATRLWSGINLGTPSETFSAPAVEERAETPAAVAEPIPVFEQKKVEETVAPIPAPEPVVEEAFQETPAPPEEAAAVAEEPVLLESIAEEPPPIEQAEASAASEDAFGLPVEPTAAEPAAQEEEPFGAAEKLGLPMTEEPPISAGYGFGTTAEPAPQAVEETPFGETPAQEPEAVLEYPLGQTPEATAEVTAEATAQEVARTAEESAAETPTAEQPDWFDAFSQLQQTPGDTPASPEAAPSAEENPFAAFGSEQPTPAADGESYEDFTARVRMELFGTEDTMTLNEYLGGATSSDGGTPDQIGELAEKLKTSPRITPPVINFAEKSNRTSSDVDEGSESGFVTPTLAEIYVKQGWYDDAIKAYRTLAGNKPEDKEKYEQRIIEIEEMKKSSK